MTLQITDAAKEKIKSLAAEKGLEDFYWRVGVRAGGCQGMENYFELSTTLNYKDTMSNIGDIRLVMDPKSAILLEGATLDWISNLMEKRFNLTLPTSKHCSCGSSFSL